MASNAENASIWWRHHGHYISIAWGKSVQPSLCRFWSRIFFALINYIPQNRCLFFVVLYVVKWFVSVFVRLGDVFNHILLGGFTVTNSIACASDVTLKDICKINWYLNTSRHKKAKVCTAWMAYHTSKYFWNNAWWWCPIIYTAAKISDKYSISLEIARDHDCLYNESTISELFVQQGFGHCFNPYFMLHMFR